MDKYYGNTGCGVFKREIENYKYFCLRINIPKRKLLNFGLMVSCQKVSKFDFQSNFLCQKSSKSFSFFIIEDIMRKSHIK